MAIQIPQAYAFALEIDISTTDPNLDLTTVTSVQLLVSRQADGTSATWTATPQSGATTTSLVAIYNVGPTDAVTTGTYEVGVSLIVPGGAVPSSSIDLFVLPLSRWRGSR